MKHTTIKATIFTAIILTGVTSVLAGPLYGPGTTRVNVGDCYADRTGSDVIQPADPYCVGKQASNTMTVKRDKQDNIVLVITATPDLPVIVIPATPTPDPVTPTPDPTDTPKVRCDKGEGNGGEGCDPGNNPDNGNNDEN